MAGRLQAWMQRRAGRKAALVEHEAAMAGGEPTEAAEPGACPTAGEGVCVDESKLPPGGEDESRLEGSLLEIGGAAAGLMPVERPDADADKRKREETSPSSECEECH